MLTITQRRILGSALILLTGSALLIALRLFSGETQCETDAPSFLKGTADDCEALRPAPDSAQEGNVASR